MLEKENSLDWSKNKTMILNLQFEDRYITAFGKSLWETLLA